MTKYITSKIKGTCEFCKQPIFLNYNHQFIVDTDKQKVKIAHQACWYHYLSNPKEYEGGKNK